MRGNNTVTTETTASVSNESGLKREGQGEENDGEIDRLSSSNVSIDNQVVSQHPNDIMIDPNWTGIDQSNILQQEDENSSDNDDFPSQFIVKKDGQKHDQERDKKKIPSGLFESSAL